MRIGCSITRSPTQTNRETTAAELAGHEAVADTRSIQEGQVATELDRITNPLFRPHQQRLGRVSGAGKQAPWLLALGGRTSSVKFLVAKRAS